MSGKQESTQTNGVPKALTTDYYELLGLPPDANGEEIRRAYRDAALQWHPDVNHQEGAHERFLLLKQAYETLSNPQARQRYDQELARSRNEPFLIETIYSRPHLPLIEEPQLIYVLVNLQPNPWISQPTSAALNLCLVLDKSTSMQGPRLDTVKDAAIELVRHLTPQDHLSIVAFSDRAQVIVSASERLERYEIETRIKLLAAEGGTEILQGLQAGHQELLQNFSPAYVNHLILITDGRTYGDEEQCLQLAEQLAHQGVRLTGMGIGALWNDAFMDELTARTGGNTLFVSRIADLGTLTQEILKSLRNTLVEKTVLNLEMGNGVNLLAAYRLQPQPAELNREPPLRLGSLAKGETLAVLLEFSLPALSEQTEGSRFTIARTRVEAVAPSNPMHPHRVTSILSRMVSREASTALPPEPILRALLQINLYRMQERARKEAAAGKIQEAQTRLQRLAGELLSMGEIELAQTAMMEAERLQRTHMLSAEGEKRIKYGTRAFLLPPRTP